MKLHIFQSQNGDCLLLESKDGKRMLCDGGMAASMRESVRDELGKLRKAGKKLDVVYISHVDNDHITGVLALLEDEVEWRLHEHRKNNGLKTKPPEFPRPPEIGTVWHNAFRDQVDENADKIESLLAAAVPALNGTGVPALATAATELEDLATAVKEALQVSFLVSPNLLKIPVNKLPGKTGKSKLLMLRKKQGAFTLGSLGITIVGPGTEELDNLRKGWNNWLNENEKTVSQIRTKMKRKIDEFSAGGNDQPFDLRDWNGIPDFEGVTAPNIASIMLMVEEAGGDGATKRLLLTGDSQQKFVLQGLEKAGFMPNGGAIHLDVLKVQHHGSENNIDAAFCKRVSADHYVFCGNGEHGNPELKVIDLIFESRLGAAANLARDPKANNRPFTFWFSTTSKAQQAGSDEQKKFAAVEKRVADLKKKAKGKLRLRFNTGSVKTLSI